MFLLALTAVFAETQELFPPPAEDAIRRRVKPSDCLSFWSCISQGNFKYTFVAWNTAASQYNTFNAADKKNFGGERLDVMDSPGPGEKSSVFNRNHPTIFFAHGFSSGLKSGRSILQALYTRRSTNPYNFIQIDWSVDAKWTGVCGYECPKNKVPKVGEDVARMVWAFHSDWADQELQWNFVHFMGHSLGAHVMANAARKINAWHSVQIQHLTGLDPAGPGFRGCSPNDAANTFGDQHRLRATDAAFVDVWHSNGKVGPTYLPSFLGDLNRMGTVDIYINGGMKQPGCTTLNNWEIGKCSHVMAKDFYAWSILDPWIGEVQVYPCNYGSGQCTDETLWKSDGVSSVGLGGYFLRGIGPLDSQIDPSDSNSFHPTWIILGGKDSQYNHKRVPPPTHFDAARVEETAELDGPTDLNPTGAAPFELHTCSSASKFEFE